MKAVDHATSLGVNAAPSKVVKEEIVAAKNLAKRWRKLASAKTQDASVDRTTELPVARDPVESTLPVVNGPGSRDASPLAGTSRSTSSTASSQVEVVNPVRRKVSHGGRVHA